MTEYKSPGRTDSASIEVRAAPGEVYAAFADASKLMRWLPPGTMTGRALEYDFRENGRYRISLSYDAATPAGVGKTEERTDVSSGRFLVLEPGRRIVQSVEFESAGDAYAGEMLMTWSFEPTAMGTKVTIRAENVPAGISQAD
ncbi:MAG TPA: SRPBCC domain-containing protein, partial [Polyangiaceae bacterium]|nr:SRPBCC domain-containing protein [Polyangiaceae bacterium]